MLKVDVFVLPASRYDVHAFERAREDTLEQTEHARAFYIAAPEDVVLNKLRWYRKGGDASDRQWGDVVGVLQVQAGALDGAYLGGISRLAKRFQPMWASDHLAFTRIEDTHLGHLSPLQWSTSAIARIAGSVGEVGWLSGYHVLSKSSACAIVPLA